MSRTFVPRQREERFAILHLKIMQTQRKLSLRQLLQNTNTGYHCQWILQEKSIIMTTSSTAWYVLISWIWLWYCGRSLGLPLYGVLLRPFQSGFFHVSSKFKTQGSRMRPWITYLDEHFRRLSIKKKVMQIKLKSG